ncbi:DHH family phosphoesterase [Heliobacterium mobile]|nr:bifunctional oligoribonuclease/PAP phosphatase NrnA [Heliobacterium mobile]
MNPVDLQQQQILQMLSQASKVLLIVHKVPDGDCLGSVSAMLTRLRGQGLQAIAYCDDPVPDSYRFLPAMDQVFQASTIPEFTPELVIVIDCADEGRIGDGSRFLQGQAPVINIDHHVGNSQFGHINWVDSQAAACGEMIYRLCTTASWHITDDMATAIYTSLMTDTGSFQYANTTPQTLRLAADLREMGARTDEIREKVFESRPRAFVNLLAQILPTLEVSDDGRVASLTVTREAMVQAGASEGDCDGLINYPRFLAGVQVALLFKEAGEEIFRVGFRSKGNIDVYAIARQFGGGGHRKASGCTLSGTLAEVKQQVLGAVRSSLEPLEIPT